MYSNARLSKPSNTHRPFGTSPRSAVEQFEVGTVAPSHSDFTPNTRQPRQSRESKRLFDTSMKTAYLRHKPEIFQTNPSIVPFCSFHEGQGVRETSAAPHNPTPHEHRSQPQSGTVLELAKHKPVAEHVGATHHQYPSTVVGDTLLRQQALLTINSLPTLISRLKADIKDIANARNGMASSKKNTPPKPGRKKEELTESVPFDDAVTQEIEEYERLLKQIERVQLRIGTTQEPLAEKDLLALKRFEVVNEATMSITQFEASQLANEAVTALKAKIASLKTPPQPKVAYAAAAAGKRSGK